MFGLHIPSKGKGVGKKRPAPDASKPPKAKVAKASKSDAKKGPAAGDEASPGAGENGDDSSVPGERDAEANGKEAVAGRKAGVKRPKKGGPDWAASTSPPGVGGLDLNVEQQPESPVADGKGWKSGKKGSPGVGAGAAGGGRTGQKTGKKEKSGKKVAAQSGAGSDCEAGCGPRAVSGNSGGGGSSIGRDVNGGSSRSEGSGGRGIDLNGWSDDDVTIVGVSAGRRLDLFASPGAGPGRRPKMSRHATEMAGSSRASVAEYRGDVEELSFSASRPSGVGFGGAHGEESSLASHLMRRLAGSSADLLSLGVPEELSQVQWPPAAGAWAAVPSLKELELGADVASLSFSEGKQRPAGAGSPSKGVARSQAAEGAARAGSVQEQEEAGQLPAWMVERQRRGGARSQEQGVGGSGVAGEGDLSRAMLRLGPSSPARGASVTSVTGASASRSAAGAGQAGSRPLPVGAQVQQQARAFPGVAAQAAAGAESQVDTGLALSLGSGSQQQKQAAGRRAARDVQAQPSAGR